MSLPTNQNNTLTYDGGAQGWPSFYSYFPDWMIGMNNYFYTFKGGNLYRHNTNEVRNNFYGVQYTSTVQSVFNDMPLENKLFKTINIEGDAAWGVTLQTDIQDSGFIEAGWFDEKEASFYAFVRNSGTVPAQPSEYVLRSLNGIGSSQTIAGSADTINFSTDIELDTMMSVGDMLYYINQISNTPTLAGQIEEININPQSGLNQIIIDTTVSGSVPIAGQEIFFFYIKNSIAESHGVLGHYCVFDIANTSTTKINLFAVESEVMKSYP
jgi:hypothetical protein|tara:strand:+ start:696 stop:1499 length:804 start_codon:yes stop_codon:yes gene_type:complete